MKKLLIITITSIFILSSCSSSKLVAPESEGEKLSILYADALKKTKKKDKNYDIQKYSFWECGQV